MKDEMFDFHTFILPPSSLILTFWGRGAIGISAAPCEGAGWRFESSRSHQILRLRSSTDQSARIRILMLRVQILPKPESKDEGGRMKGELKSFFIFLENQRS